MTPERVFTARGLEKTYRMGEVEVAALGGVDLEAQLETWRVLVGEVALQLAGALPAGVLLGWGLSVLSAHAFESDLFRMPVFISRSTWALGPGHRRDRWSHAGHQPRCAAVDSQSRPGGCSSLAGVTMIVRRGGTFAVIVLAAAVAAVLLALRPAAVPVSVATADSGPVQVTVDWIGKTRVRDRYQVAAPVAGELRRVTVRAGDAVRAGAAVAHVAGGHSPPLDPRSRAEAVARLEAAVAAEAEAAAALERATSAAHQARSEAARAEAVARQGGLSAEALEAARVSAELRDAERTMAVAASRRAAAEASAARAALQTGGGTSREVTVHAPADGAVLRVLRESAGPIGAGAPVLEIGARRIWNWCSICPQQTRWRCARDSEPPPPSAQGDRRCGPWYGGSSRPPTRRSHPWVWRSSEST